MIKRRYGILLGAIALLGVTAVEARADLLDMPKVNAKSEAQLRSAWVAYRAGDVLSVPGKINEALQTAHEAHDSTGEAAILLAKSTLTRMTGRNERADELEKQADAILETLSAQERLSIFFGAGLALREAGLLEVGAKWIERGAKEAIASGDARARAQTLHLQGLFAWESNHDQARALWNQALPLWQQCGDNSGKAWTLLRLGMLAQGEADGSQALRLLSEARVVAQKGQQNEIKARTSSEMMVFYEGNGELERAHDFGVEALTFSEKSTGPLMEMQRSLVLSQLAHIASRTNNLEEVTKFGDEGRQLAHNLGRKRAEINFLLSLGWAYLNLGKPDLAAHSIEEGLALIEGNPGTGTQITGAKQNLQNAAFYIYMAQGQRERALQMADALPDEFWCAGAKSAAAEARGDLNTAIEKLTLVLKDVEWRRSRLGDLTSAKIGYLADKRENYGRLVDLLLRQNRPEEAFAWVELARGRGLLDVMDGGRATSDKSFSPTQKETKVRLLDQVSRANARVLSLQMGEEEGSAKLETAKTEAGAASRAFGTFLDEVAVNSPSLAVTGQTLSASDLEKVLPTDTAVVEFAFVDGGEVPTPVHRLVAFVARKDGDKTMVRAINLDTTRDELSELVTDFAAACSDPKKSFKTKARELDRLLLEPLSDAVGDAKRLIVCPEGPLWGAPFAAFMDGKGQYAAQRWELVLGFSATTALRLPTLIAGDKVGANDEMLVVANPDFGGPQRLALGDSDSGPRGLLANSRALTANSRGLTANSRAFTANSRGGDSSPTLRALITREGAIRPLPGTAREARSIATDFPKARVLEGKEASEATISAQMGKFRFVHFATHGLFNDADPLGSSLVLAAPPANAKDDGFLSAREIFDLDLHAEMVVLSACNTGQGERRDGEGVMGLTWALAAAGAKAQIVSGWAVNDDSTAKLMASFYARLKDKEPRGSALRGAMQSLQSDPQTAHPFYWAPFFLLGDWR